jgi:hypothetical protein
MMPQLVTVKVRRPEARPVRVWVPVLPVLLVLSPILVLAAVGGAVACLIYRISVLRAVGTGWRIVSALPGAHFDIDDGRWGVLVRIS